MKKVKIIVLIVLFLALLTTLISKNEKVSSSYNISEFKCIGCEACVDACPVQAISLVGGKAVIDQTKCIQCGICVNGNYSDYVGCPVKAINPPVQDASISENQ